MDDADLRRLRWRLVISMAVVVPLGFATKFHHGPGADWVKGSLGGALYEVFWCLGFQFLFPCARATVIALAVLAGTCALEFLQLWHPPFLETLRASFIGRTILGDTFAWSDFPYYFAGSALGWWWLRKLATRPTLSN
ncbi:MAG: DUF2809 domain-containing protein [Verrucomicrobiota bacterium]